MSGRVQQICEALVTLLDAADDAEVFSETLNATRLPSQARELSDVGESIDVVVASQITRRDRISNGSYGRYVVVDILIRAHLTNDADADLATMDSRDELLEQVDNYLAAEENSDLTIVDTIAEYVEPTDSRAPSEVRDGLGLLWVSDDMTDMRQRTGIVRVAYWVDESY